MELVKSAFIGGVLHDLNEALGFEGFEVRESFPLRGYKIVPVCYPHAFMESANGERVLRTLFTKAAITAGFAVNTSGYNGNIEATMSLPEVNLFIGYNPIAGAYHFVVSKKS